ncbi:hypothetical protein I4F81_009779 [Pyropia yezoensis]|uniref:Uncharacterized protein n=1 Tax=Pyropia yezoensis TaxID=2788 RepID=A0ACC3CAS7_PYRYE|nr:hypothetical protein I4F81_009779 [Neopyropia yezoensis]
MDGGLAGVPPSTGASATALEESAALRARLAVAEADLTQTQAALVAAQADLTDRDDAAAANAVGGGGAPAGAGGRGGAAVDGVPAAPAASGDAGTPAPDAIAPAATGAGQAPLAGGAVPGGAPLGTDAPGDYADDAEGDGGDSDGGGSWNPARRDGGGAGPGGRWTRTNLDGVASYDDGFDFYKSYTPSDWLRGFDIPRAVVRPDGMPMPFTPADPVHTATFPVGSRDELEARHWYCSLAWLEQLYNDALAARHSTGHTVDALYEQLEYVVGSTRRIHALGVSRYDYLALRQSEPNLADAFAHADAVPRNSLRGDGARRFLSRVARAETHASAKIGAAERGTR